MNTHAITRIIYSFILLHSTIIIFASNQNISLPTINIRRLSLSENTKASSSSTDKNKLSDMQQQANEYQKYLQQNNIRLRSLFVIGLTNKASWHDEVDYLLSCGASIDNRNSQGQTLLHYFIFYEQYNLAHLALEKGASVFATTNQGKTALLVEFSKLGSEWQDQPNNQKLIDALMIRGANSHAVDNDGNSIFHYIADHCNHHAIEQALKLGININSRNKLGQTPICMLLSQYIAPHSQERIFKTVEKLLEAGADINISDYNNKNVLDSSYLKNYSDYIPALQQAIIKAHIRHKQINDVKQKIRTTDFSSQHNAQGMVLSMAHLKNNFLKAIQQPLNSSDESVNTHTKTSNLNSENNHQSLQHIIFTNHASSDKERALAHYHIQKILELKQNKSKKIKPLETIHEHPAENHEETPETVTAQLLTHKKSVAPIIKKNKKK